MQATYTPPTPLEMAQIEAMLIDMQSDQDRATIEVEREHALADGITAEEFEDYLARSEEARP